MTPYEGYDGVSSAIKFEYSVTRTSTPEGEKLDEEEIITAIYLDRTALVAKEQTSSLMSKEKWDGFCPTGAITTVR